MAELNGLRCAMGKRIFDVMKDYRRDILNNLRPYDGIVSNPDVVEHINGVLVRLSQSECSALLNSFCSQTEPDRARDLLFEVLVFHWLSSDVRVRQLTYEPNDDGGCPDFRFVIGGVAYDIQIKRIHNIESELPKARFLCEVDRRLQSMSRSWLMDLWISDQIRPDHTNRFAEHVAAHPDEYAPGSELGEKEYRWSEAGKTLVRFSFVEKGRHAPASESHSSSEEPGSAL